MVEALQSRVSSLQQEVHVNHEKNLKCHSQILELQTSNAEMMQKAEQEKIEQRLERKFL